MAHPSGFTHVLKADDDTHVRMHRVIDALQEPASTSMQSIVDTAVAAAAQRAKNAAAITDHLKDQLAQASRQRGRPILSDSMVLYDGSSLLDRANGSIPGYSAKNTVDDIDGSAVTINELARRTGLAFPNEITTAPKSSLGANEDEGNQMPMRRGLQQLDPGQGHGDQRGERGVGAAANRPRMSGVYLGCIEVNGGFEPIRDPRSKWYISQEELPDDVVPWGVRYLAGWGYVLSRDLANHAVSKVNAFQKQPENAPAWFR